MISRKTAKDRNKKVIPVKEENRKQLITRSTTKSSPISGVKQRKSAERINFKSKASKQSKSIINKKNKTQKSQESSSTVGPNVKLRLSSRKKSTKVKKIKEISKKIKTKASNKLGKVAKRKLRNNKKGFEDKKMKSLNSDKTRISKSNDNAVSHREQEKFNLRNGSPSPKPNSTNLCAKLFPLNCIKPSNSKTSNKNKKPENNKNKFKVKPKNESKKSNKKQDKIESLNDKKVKVKDKKQEKEKSINTKKKSNSSSNTSKKKVQNQTQSSRNDFKSPKPKTKTNKSDSKSSQNEKSKKSFKNGSTVKRGHRLASLNAIAKVRLLCENEREKSDTIEESSDYYLKQNCKKEKVDRKCTTKSNSNKSESKKDCKALVAVNNSNKQLAVRKRKMIDDSIEIIDTRSCKRMASLNASAIMAASYSPERIKRSKSVESTHSNSSIEMVREMQISSTVSRFEISPSVNGINGLHVSEAKSVILKAQKHETIETVKKMKVSSKIRDRLLGIARLERHEKAKKKRKGLKNQNSDSHCISDDNESIENAVSSAEVAGFQATKVQVTKVTQINTGVKLDKDKKSGHKIESILERDSSVVHKYQVQTKSTIQMQTTFNPSNGSSLTNVTTMSSPQMPSMGSTPRMQVHISATPAQVIPTPILSTSSSGQPTYFNIHGSAPVLHLHNNQYQAMASSAPHLNPLSIINFSEPYPTHYTSAFSVPHFATHTHPQAPFNYFHPGIYQPAGPLLQPLHDPCLIHKPIPFHPQTPQASHVHGSQFSSGNLQTPNTQTFQNQISQPFTSTAQFFQQFQNSMRPPQAVFFQALPQTNASIAPNTTFTLVNPNLHYTQPTIINAEQFAHNENQFLSRETTFSNSNPNTTTTTTVIPSVAQSSNDNSVEHLCKGIQCSPQSKDKFQTITENQFRDSTNQSIRKTQNNKTPTIVTVRPQVAKKSNKSDNPDKRKKSLLLKTPHNRKTEDMVMVRNNSQVMIAEHRPEVSTAKSLKSALTPSNVNKTNSINKLSSHKLTKTVCVQVNTSMPSVTMPSLPLLPSPLPRVLPSRKSGKKRYSHGWSWEGVPQDKYIYFNVFINFFY
jgi:hypothetical protein